MNSEHFKEAAEFERALFGAAILAPTQLDELSELVSESDFHETELGRAFGLMVDLQAAGYPVSDVRLLVGRLRGAGLLDALGGVSFIAQAVETNYAHNARWYAVRVAELSQLRALDSMGSQLTAEAGIVGADPIALREHFEARLAAIQQREGNADVETLGGMVTDALEEIRQARQRGESLGLSSRMAALDNATGGFFNGDLTILAARPSIGKSAFAVELAARLAEQQKRVLIVSLEMSGKQIAHRFLNRETGIPVRAMQSGDLNAYQETQLIEAKERLRQLPLKSFVTSNATVSKIRARARVQMAQEGLDLLIIDYLGLIGGNSKLSAYERTTAISRELKQLAMDIDRPVLCLAQLNREAAKSSLPSLEHLRDSGAIEQDCDNCWLLHRDDRATSETKLIIAKQRQGCVGTIELVFNADRMSFDDGQLMPSGAQRWGT